MNTMFRLPPPPRFILPPPPMLPTDIFNSKTFLQLTCSSIRTHSQQINPQLILISCIIFFIIAIFLTLLFICFQSCRHQRTFIHTFDSKNLSICSSRTLFLRPDSAHSSPLYHCWHWFILSENLNSILFSVFTNKKINN